MIILILLSTYNGEKYLIEQLDSIRLQRDIDITLLIRDDGSTDNTIELINDYINKSPEFKIELIKGENLGFALSFSKLLETAYQKYQQGTTFDYYAFADQDDVWLPEKLYEATQMLTKIESQNHPITYCSNTTLVWSDLSIIGNTFNSSNFIKTKESALVKNLATGCTMVFNLKAVEIYVNHIPKVIKYHDFYMYQLCSFLGETIFDCNSYILYRQHENNQIGRLPSKEVWTNRIKRQPRKSNKYRDGGFCTQNQYHLEALRSELGSSDIELFSRVAFYKQSVIFRLRLLFDRRIRRYTFNQNLFYRLSIIRGRL